MRKLRPPPPMPDVLKDGPSNPKPRSAPIDAGMMNQLMRMAAIGTNVAFAVVGGALLGWGADWLLGTKPWGLLGGAGLGVLAGITTFIREGRKLFAPPTSVRPEPDSKPDQPAR